MNPFQFLGAVGPLRQIHALRRIYTLRLEFILWFLLVLRLFFLCPASVQAQMLYPSSQGLGLQSATLENIMILQQLRNTETPCIGYNAWAAAYGLGGYSRGEVEYRYRFNEETQFDKSLGGSLFGFDTNLGASSRLGAFFTYNSSRQTNESSFNEEKMNVNNYLWGLYGRKEEESFYLMGTAGIGHARMNEHYASTTPIIPWEYNTTSNAWRAFLYGEIGTEMSFGGLNVQPFWGVQYYYASNGSSQDTYYDSADDPSTIGFPSLEMNSLRNVLGIRLAQTLWAEENRAIQLNCLSFWYHEFLNLKNLGGGNIGFGDSTIQDSFFYSWQNSGRDWAVIAPTVEWKIGNLRLWGGYIALFNSQEVLQVGQGGIAYCW